MKNNLVCSPKTWKYTQEKVTLSAPSAPCPYWWEWNLSRTVSASNWVRVLSPCAWGHRWLPQDLGFILGRLPADWHFPAWWFTGRGLSSARTSPGPPPEDCLPWTISRWLRLEMWAAVLGRSHGGIHIGQDPAGKQMAHPNQDNLRKAS